MKFTSTFAVVATSIALGASTAWLLIVKEPTAAATSSAVQSTVVVRDQESGGLRAATAIEAARYAEPPVQTERKSDLERLTRRADGSESLRLDDRYMTYLTVQRDASGDWRQTCRLDHDHHQAHSAQMPAAHAEATR